MDFIPYVLLLLPFLTILSKWVKKSTALVLILPSILCGFYLGRIDILGIAFVVCYGLACFALYKATETWQKHVASLFLLIFSLVLFFHLAPGFENFRYLDKVFVGASKQPFSLWFNLDKPMIGILPLIYLYSFKRAPLSFPFKKIFFVITFCLASAITIGIALDLFSWDPKIPKWSFWWMYKVLFLTVIPEQVLHRLLIQEWLTKVTKEKWSAGFISAVIFGLLHFSMGPSFCVVAFWTGLFHAYLFTKTRRLWPSVFCHFLVNAVHFFFFTYPGL